MRAGELTRSHLHVVTARECPDLTISKVVRLLLAPETPAQGERGPPATLLFLLAGWSQAFSFSLLFLCWLFCFTNEALHEG